MKTDLRTALAIANFDDENEYQELTEELQAYSLLAACHNQDEAMLRYLWEQFGSFMWEECLFGVVVRYMIETSWTEGLTLILRSRQTHSLIRSMTDESRSFFVENMIGNI